MADVTLCLAFHCHQPVGNFDHVVADAFARCYHPMLEVFAAHPTIPFGLHWSGILYDWADRHEPRTVELLHRLVDRGQVELLGGGYYEPLLPLLPRADVVGQFCAMQTYLREHFGQTAAGFWLTERVWEPQVPSLCAPAGLRYTLTDDTHFRAAGLPLDALVGYYLTEDNGAALGVFPLDKALRYLIPFREPAETIRRLRDVAEARPGVALTYGDDGEKFGLWPGTYDWVYTRGYLHRLCEAIEREADWLHVCLPGAYRATQPPTGRIYLPTASYDEMETWVLAAEDQLRYDALMHADLPADTRRFLRGGFFRNYLRKYDEANLLHKRMLQVSDRIAALGNTATDTMRRELWQGQCSCPYWHGLFGGLYLNGIRQANHAHLIRAGALADAASHGPGPWAEVETGDVDCDGADEVVVRGSAMEIWMRPHDGGTVSLLDDRRTARMLSDVLTRRPEPYHAKVSAADRENDAGEDPKSIHDRVAVKEEGLSELLHYDAATRTCFRDRVLPPEARVADAVAGRLEAGDGGAPTPCHFRITPGPASVEVEWHGPPPGGSAGAEVSLTKRFAYDDAAATLALTYEAEGVAQGGPLRFATELNLTLLASDAPDRRLEIVRHESRHGAHLGEAAETCGVTGFALIDEYAGATLRVSCAPAAELWHYPIETVSNSESGYERTYQGTAFLLVWEWDLVTGPAPRVQLRLESHE